MRAARAARAAMARESNPFPHGSVRHALYEVLSDDSCVQGMHISRIKEEVVAMRAADERIWPNFPKAKTPESTISAALSTSGGVFEKVGPAKYRVNVQNAEIAQGNYRARDGKRSKFVLQPNKRKAEETNKSKSNKKGVEGKKKKLNSVGNTKGKEKRKGGGAAAGAGTKNSNANDRAGNGVTSNGYVDEDKSVGFRPYAKPTPITTLFPYQKATVFKRTDSPLCVVDLADIINETVFQEILTEEEQQDLLKYLPEVDIIEANGDKKQRGFRSSSRLRETFGEFQEMLNRGIFDNDAGYPPGVARHYTEILYNTDLHKIDWWGRKPSGRLSHRRALSSNPIAEMQQKYAEELQQVKSMFGKF